MVVMGTKQIETVPNKCFCRSIKVLNKSLQDPHYKFELRF